MPGIEFGMNVEGVEDLQRALDRMPGLMHHHVERALNRVGADIHHDAFRMCPVRSGRLRNSIFHKVEDWVLTVGVGAPYASFVEFGTRYIQARYFLTEAFHLNFPKLQSTLEWALDAAIAAIQYEGGLR